MKSPRLYIMLLDLYPIHKNEFFSTEIYHFVKKITHFVHQFD